MTNNREVFYCYPNKVKPKLLLSYNSNISIKGIQMLSNNIKNYLIKFILYIVFKTKLNVFFLKNTNIVPKNNEDLVISKIIAKCNGLNNIQVNIDYNKYVGGSGLYRKSTVQLLDFNYNTFGFIKLSNKFYPTKSIKNEAKILDYLNNKLNSKLLVVPSVLDKGYINDYYFTIQSTILCHTFNESISNLLNALTDLFNSTKLEKKVLFETNTIILILQEMSKLKKDFKNADKDNVVNNIFKIVENGVNLLTAFKDEEINCCINHNDFTPWNIKFSKDRVFVFDWEWAEIEGLPLIDFLHFIIMPQIVVKKKKAKNIMDYLNSNYVLGLLKKYCNSINLDNNLILNMIIIYLIKNIVFYLRCVLVENKCANEDLVLIRCTEMLDIAIKMFGDLNHRIINLFF